MKPVSRVYVGLVLLAYALVLNLLPTNAASAPPRQFTAPQFANPVTDPVEAALRLTTSRGRQAIVPTETIQLDRSLTDGDRALWLMDHPWVPYVVHAYVVEASAEALGPATVTRCKFRVLESFKGAPGSTVEALSWGGEVAGQAAIYHHLPRCEVGDEVVTPILDVRGTFWVVGSDSLYAVISSADDPTPRTWGLSVREFFAGNMGEIK